MAAELHPLVRMVLRRAPAGAFLDAAVLRFRPEPGAVSHPIGAGAAAEIQKGRRLTGTQLVASSTDDPAQIEEFLSGGNPSVVRALCLNPNLTHKDAGRIAQRAVANKDGALAMAIVRGRTDVGALAAAHGPLFDYLSLRGGHGAVSALAATILRMSTSEYQALRNLPGDRVAEFRSLAADEVFELVRGGHHVNPEVLAELLAKFSSSRGLYRLRPSRGLLVAIAEMSQKQAKAFSQMLPSSASTTNHHGYTARRFEHECSASAMAAVAKAVGMKFDSDGTWETWTAPMRAFAALDRAAQLAALGSGEDAAGELLYHFPDLHRLITVEEVAALPVQALEKIASFPGTHGAIREAAIRGLIPARAEYAPVVGAVLPKDGEDTAKELLAFSLDACFADGDSRDGLHLIEVYDTMQVLGALPLMRNERALTAVRQKLLQAVALDPFARREWLDGLVDFKCTNLAVADWAQPALEWAADRIIEAGIDGRNLDVLLRLVGGWTMTIPELASAVRKL